MLRRVALVRTYVKEERIAFIIRVTRIGELGISNRNTLRKKLYATLMMEAILSSETSVLARDIWPKFPEDGSLRSAFVFCLKIT
jgi:hypothetical protein